MACSSPATRAERYSTRRVSARGSQRSTERHRTGRQRDQTEAAFCCYLDGIFSDVDLLLTPSAAGEAPEGLGSTGDPSFNSIWTLAWTPCVTLPAGTGPKGLPLGIQLVGPRFRDEATIDTAAWVEARL